jgi:hypothetical protein
MEKEMDNKQPRVHFYDADANAIGGRVERPFEQIVPVQAALSLPSVGGYATSRSEDFRFQGILSCRAAQTQVAGSFNEGNGSWTTIVSATIENLNVLDVVTADRVVAQISTEHPRVGYTPKVSFIGTQFINLRIGGCKIEPVLDLGLCDQDGGNDYPKQPCIQDREFLNKVGKLHQNMRSEPKDKANLAWSRYRDWLEQRYPSSESDTDPDEKLTKERGMVLCSLVQDIQGDCPWNPFGHVIVVPEFGKIFLGELLLDHNSFHLIMLRLELGCPLQGSIGISDTRTNGTTMP